MRADTGAGVVMAHMSVSAFCWFLPAGRGHWCGGFDLGVAVGCGDDDVEISTVLSVVYGRFFGDAGTPESALVVGNGGGIGAGGAGVDAGVPLDVDVEGGAEVFVVAERGTARDVVGLESGESQVGVGVDGGVFVGEGGDVSGWDIGVLGFVVEWLVGEESVSGIWVWLWSVT
jgi:hypothetical protein